MPGSIFSRSVTFVRNILRHAKRVLFFKERARDAMRGVLHDSGKWLASFINTSRKRTHRNARQFVRKGRQEYNLRNYDKAENQFRHALLLDNEYAEACAFLGHALYKQQKLKEAVYYWEKAVDMDPHGRAGYNARSKLAIVERQRATVENWIQEHTRR